MFTNKVFTNKCIKWERCAYSTDSTELLIIIIILIIFPPPHHKMKCIVRSCSSDFHCGASGWVPKHRFPKGTAQRHCWLQAIANAENIARNVENINFKTARVCSKHFTSQSFCYRGNKKFLIDGAVPTIFELERYWFNYINVLKVAYAKYHHFFTSN